MLHLRVEIPAHDGTILRGLRYAPSTEPAPTILSITPYGADRYHADGVYFASRGFDFVTLDCRGRGDSDGEFVPFVNEAADGNAVVHRLAEHPWSNGEIVTYGGSYGGYNQWALAATHPQPLRAIAPSAAVYPGRDFPAVSGIPLQYAVRWLTLVNGRRHNNGPFADEAFWRNASRDLIASGRPYRDLDLHTVGDRLPVFQEWLDHPDLDDYWRDLVREPNLAIPALTITGQYDDDQLGALTHLAAADTDTHDVVIGPWDHAGTRTSALNFGGLSFDTAAIDLKALHADWYSWVLGRGPRPEFLADRVTYFHIGENRWRTSTSMPVGDNALHLHPAPGATLTATAPGATTLTVTIDPRKASARPEQFETETFVFPLTALTSYPEALVHLTAPLTDPLDVTGCPSAHLTLSSDLPSFDLLVSIYLVRADTATKLGEHPFRARHLAAPHQAVLPDFAFISLRTEPGDRIALVISPPDLRFAPNYHTGGHTPDELPSHAVAGTVRIHQDPAQPSYLRLPLAR